MRRTGPILIGGAVLGAVLLGAVWYAQSAAEKRSLHAMIEADHASGVVTLNCSESSSGTCQVLFVTGDNIERLTAAVGASTGETGITAETRYCIDTIEPANGCALKPLADGQQIIRQQKSH